MVVVGHKDAERIPNQTGPFQELHALAGPLHGLGVYGRLNEVIRDDAPETPCHGASCLARSKRCSASINQMPRVGKMRMEERIETSQGKFFLRPFAPEDEAKVLDLWAAAFHKKMPLPLWQWKYVANPFGTPMMVCVSESGEIAAFFAAIRYPALWKGRQTFMLHAVDNMSHPAYRGVLSGRKGLFARTAEHFFRCHTGPEKSVFVYGYPGVRHFRLGHHLLGYTALPRGVTFLRDQSNKMRRKRSLSFRIVETVQTASEDFDHFCQSAAREYPFAVRRDAAFIRWRFLDHPSQKYQLWVCRSFRTRRIMAFAAVHRQEGRAQLVDLLALGDDKDTIRLLAEIASDLASAGGEVLECWLPSGHFLTNLLRTIGFEEAPEPFGFVPACVNRSFHPNLDITWAMRNFFYTLADADLL